MLQKFKLFRVQVSKQDIGLEPSQPGTKVGPAGEAS